MSKKGMKLTGILQNHNQHPESDQKYQPLRTNIRNSKQKPIQTQLKNISYVSRKLQSLSPQQAQLIKNTAFIPVNCGLRVTSNEERQHQALQRRYVAINMYQKEGSKPITPNTFSQLPKNQKYQVVYEYHCPNSQGQVQEYQNSENMTQSKRVITDRQNYQLNDYSAVKNGISPAGQQNAQQTVIRNNISPSSSNQVIRNNVSPSGQAVQSKVSSQKIYGPIEGKPIEGEVSHIYVKNNIIYGSKIKSHYIIDYEVKSRIKSPESNIKGITSVVNGSTSAVKGSTSAVKNQTSEVQQNRRHLQSERRTDVISGTKGNTQSQEEYRGNTGNISLSPIKVITPSKDIKNSRGNSTEKNVTNVKQTSNNQSSAQSIQRNTQGQQVRRSSVSKQVIYGPIQGQSINGVNYHGPIGSHEGQQGSTLITSKVMNYEQSSQKVNQQGIRTNNSPSTKVIRQTTLQGQHKNTGQSATGIKETYNTQEINNRTSQNYQRNTSSKDINGSNVSRQIIYGPNSGQPINGAILHHGSIQGKGSIIISSSKHVVNYGPSISTVNQGIRTNTSPSTKIIRQGTSPNRGSYQQTKIYTREEYRTDVASTNLVANDDNAYLSGPAFFETEGRTKYNQIGRNSRQQHETGSKKQIASGGTGGKIEIGGRSKANTKQTFDDFESNFGINSRHNQVNMGSTREYSRRDIGKQDILDGQETQVKGQYHVEREDGDMENSKHREYVQNVQSRIIIGGSGNIEGRSQQEIVFKNKNKFQISKEQAEHVLKGQKQRSQYSRNQQQLQNVESTRQSQAPLNLNISTRQAADPSAYNSPQIDQRKKKLSEYQQTGTKGYNFKKNSTEQTQSKRKKQQYKYNLYSVFDEQFNLKCATGLCMANEICASSPKRQGWK